MRVRWSAGILLPVASLAAVLLLAACGAGETERNTSVRNSGPGVTVTVPPTTALSTATPAGASAVTTGGSSAALAASATQRITIIAKDNFFDPKDLTIPANQLVAVTLKNEGTAIHNWQILNVTDKDGKTVKTKLISGGQSDTVVFTMSRTGTFDFYCEVHPVEMRGKITVR